MAYWREDGKPKRQSFGTDDRTVAERAFREWLEPSFGGDLGDIIESYIEARWEEVQHPRRLQETYKQLAPFWAERPVESVQEAVCKEYITFRGDHLSSGTVRRELATLRAALRWAERKGIIDRAPYVWLPRKPLARERRLTRDEASRLLASCLLPHLKLFVTIGIHTGARSGAILDLEWNRVDFERRLLDLRNPSRAPTRKGRAVVPINHTLLPILVDSFNARTTRYVVEWAGKPVKSVRRAFKEAVKRAGVEPCSPHTLRHTAACWMAEAGVSMPEIAAFLGHEDSRTTERVYAKFSPTYLQNAARALGGDGDVVVGGSH